MEDPKEVKGGFTNFSSKEETQHSHPWDHKPLTDSPHPHLSSCHQVLWKTPTFSKTSPTSSFFFFF